MVRWHQFLPRRDEIFGPVISLIEYDTLDEAIAILNDFDIGLTAAFLSNIAKAIARLVDGCQAGMLHVNHGMAPIRLRSIGVSVYRVPIAADVAIEQWQQLAQRSPIPLAAGENLRGGDFVRFVDARCLKVLQPDVAKWGGFTGCLPLGELAGKASAWLCPQWLAGGIGLLATLHLKAAVGGEGFAEVDANPIRCASCWRANCRPLATAL